MAIYFKDTVFADFIDDEGNSWDSTAEIPPIIGSISADLELFNCVIEGTTPTEQPAQIEADFQPWDGELIPYIDYPYVVGEFQLWNATGWANVSSISGDFAPFTSEISGEFSFNHVIADMAEWDGEASAGAEIAGAISQFNAYGAGSVGMTFGVNGVAEKWGGEIYSGGVIEDLFPEFTAESVGEVSHLDRITADIMAFTGEIEGNSDIVANISATAMMWSGSLLATIINPATITGDFKGFSGESSAINHDPMAIEASFLEWGAKDRIFATFGELPFIVGDFLLVEGGATSVSELDDRILTHVRGETR